MSGASTATVETLTAEVRVLMVGSRQVTLSVAKQLDIVSLTLLEPFGRIKIGDALPGVIGAHTQTGELSTAYARNPIDRRTFVTFDPVDGLDLPQVCPKLNAAYSEDLAMSFDGWPILLPRTLSESAHEPRYIHGCECTSWDPKDYRKVISQQVFEHRQAWRGAEKSVAAVKDLPLIVLAGLK